MNSKPIRTTGLLVVVFSVTTLGAQNASGDVAASPVKKAQQQGLNLCLMGEKTEAAEWTTLETYSSPALENAMLSSTTFWDFITDPSTPYIDRMAAANRGGSMLSPEELPLLWQAMVESALSPQPSVRRPVAL